MHVSYSVTVTGCSSAVSCSDAASHPGADFKGVTVRWTQGINISLKGSGSEPRPLLSFATRTKSLKLEDGREGRRNTQSHREVEGHGQKNRLREDRWKGRGRPGSTERGRDI